MSARILAVVDIVECNVDWSDDRSILRIWMSDEIAYEGPLEPWAGFDFVRHANDLGLVPDRPKEFARQVARGLAVLAVDGRRCLH